MAVSLTRRQAYARKWLRPHLLTERCIHLSTRKLQLFLASCKSEQAGNSHRVSFQLHGSLQPSLIHSRLHSIVLPHHRKADGKVEIDSGEIDGNAWTHIDHFLSTVQDKKKAMELHHQQKYVYNPRERFPLWYLMGEKPIRNDFFLPLWKLKTDGWREKHEQEAKISGEWDEELSIESEPENPYWNPADKSNRMETYRTRLNEGMLKLLKIEGKTLEEQDGTASELLNDELEGDSEDDEEDAALDARAEIFRDNIRQEYLMIGTSDERDDEQFYQFVKQNYETNLVDFESRKESLSDPMVRKSTEEFYEAVQLLLTKLDEEQARSLASMDDDATGNVRRDILAQNSVTKNLFDDEDYEKVDEFDPSTLEKYRPLSTKGLDDDAKKRLLEQMRQAEITYYTKCLAAVGLIISSCGARINRQVDIDIVKRDPFLFTYLRDHYKKEWKLLKYHAAKDNAQIYRQEDLNKVFRELDLLPLKRHTRAREE